MLLLACADKAEPSEETAAPDTSVETGVESDSAESGDSGDSADTETGETGDSDTGEDTGPLDADGDGHPEGEDCDDADPWTYPGAEEWCDPKDHDCDGEALAPGVCGKPQDLRAMSLEATNGKLLLTADLDDDGIADAMWGLPITPETEVPTPEGGTANGLGFYRGGDTTDLPVTDVSQADSYLPLGPDGCHYYVGGVVHTLGDADGDGFPDVAFPAEYCAWGIYVIPGPFPTDGSTRWTEDTDLYWRTPRTDPYYTSWSANRAFGGDLDGDGLGDFAASTEDTSLIVYRGGDWGETGATLTTGAGAGSPSTPLFAEDLDGDGLTDIVVDANVNVAESTIFLLSGADISGGEDLAMQDVAFAWTPDRPGGDLGTISAGDYPIYAPGDWTGDGHPDLAINLPDSDRCGYRLGEVILYDQPLTGLLDVTTASGGWCGSKEFGPILMPQAQDIDGDGLREGFFESNFGGWIVPHRAPGPFTEVSGLFLEEGVFHQFLEGAHDFDNDGYRDVSVQYSDEETVTSGTKLLLGWAIPWDDAQWW